MNLAPSVFYDEQQKHLNLWWQGTLVLCVFLALNSLLYVLDPRMLGDEALWIKPLKFEISLIIHFATLAVLAAWLSPEKRNGHAWKITTSVVVGAGLLEVMYIFLQAARGRESHFNNTTTIESLMYGLMGVGAVILVAGSFYLGYLLFREYQLQKDDVFLFSAALGLTIGSVLTLIIASHLASGETGYLAPVDEEVLRMPLFSWYLNGEDLRIPHFFATHMMQLLPLYGFWLSRRNLPIANARAQLFWSVGIYTGIVVLLFVIALF